MSVPYHCRTPLTVYDSMAGWNASVSQIAEWTVTVTEPSVTSVADLIVNRPPRTPLQEKVISLWLVKYALIVIILLGTIGNILAFLVLMRKRMRTTSVNYYLACLACADTVVLYTSGFKTWLRVVTGFEMLHVSNAGCKTVTFVFMVALHASAWLIVLLTLDRFLAVLFPFKASSWCSLRRARINTLVMAVLLCGYLLHLFWTVDLQHFPGRDGQQITVCAPAANNHFMRKPFNSIKFASYSLIPFVLVLSMNLGIIVRLCRQSPGVSVRTDTSPRLCAAPAVQELWEKRIQTGKRQVTVMLLLVSCVWLFCSVPFTLISMITWSRPTPKAWAVFYLAKTSCFLLMYINHSVNFLLYCIAGRKFRLALRHLLSDVCTMCRKPLVRHQPLVRLVTPCTVPLRMRQGPLEAEPLRQTPIDGEPED